ncbi:hypothetical protein [Shinella sp.]|uniref:hypothetical protein n=1 Tax=Shinella sp. TaxID=1870904 RepID=UPI0025862287|nr:hypothetical protein [Shinella sp.]MCW5707235.1 hypothetical protein [Shinella sp.]
MNELASKASIPLGDEIANASSRVGQTIVSESDYARVWRIKLAPGERMGFHRHELDYCWIALTDGQARSVFADGRIQNTNYAVGDCTVFAFDDGETMIHDLTNTGDSELAFTTIEFKGSLKTVQSRSDG